MAHDAKRNRSFRRIDPVQPGDPHLAIPHDPDFEETLKIADEIIDEYKDTLATLAGRTEPSSSPLCQDKL
jgi:hypothetical protein